MYLAAVNPVIRNGDLFGFIERAESIRLTVPSALVSGFYPLGYPVLLRLAYRLSGDYAVAGMWLSWLAGVAGLTVAYALAARAWSATAGLVAAVTLATNPTYIWLATTGGTDLPAATLMLLSVYLVVRTMPPTTGGALAAGAALGCAYLIRYTSATIIPAVLLWLALTPLAAYASAWRARTATLFLAGFLVAASPQLIASTVVHGNPFYNTQVQNVHFGMFGNQNWGLNIAASKRVSSLPALILENPTTFARHWYRNVVDALKDDLVQFPAGLLSCAGLLLLLRPRRTRDAGLLLGLAAGAFTLAVAMAFVTPRLLVFVTMIAAASAGVALAGLPPRRLTLRGVAVPLRTCLVVAFTVWLVWDSLVPVVRTPQSAFDRQRLDVSAALEADGATASADVLALVFDYYDVNSPTKDRYGIPWYRDDFVPYTSIADIATRMRAAGQSHLVFDGRAATTVPGLDRIWRDPQLDLQRDFDRIRPDLQNVWIYRLKPQASIGS